ncbi:MAG TPA: hypothetical protein DIS66_08375, partial [Candidatus Omnitrophica bacterium]|nr:hypothetical protein [Candidatus Omnitrophota bacterium]
FGIRIFEKNGDSFADLSLIYQKDGSLLLRVSDVTLRGMAGQMQWGFSVSLNSKQVQGNAGAMLAGFALDRVSEARQLARSFNLFDIKVSPNGKEYASNGAAAFASQLAQMASGWGDSIFSMGGMNLKLFKPVGAAAEYFASFTDALKGMGIDIIEMPLQTSDGANLMWSTNLPTYGQSIAETTVVRDIASKINTQDMASAFKAMETYAAYMSETGLLYSNAGLNKLSMFGEILGGASNILGPLQIYKQGSQTEIFGYVGIAQNADGAAISYYINLAEAEKPHKGLYLSSKEGGIAMNIDMVTRQDVSAQSLPFITSRRGDRINEMRITNLMGQPALEDAMLGVAMNHGLINFKQAIFYGDNFIEPVVFQPGYMDGTTGKVINEFLAVRSGDSLKVFDGEKTHNISKEEARLIEGTNMSQNVQKMLANIKGEMKSASGIMEMIVKIDRKSVGSQGTDLQLQLLRSFSIGAAGSLGLQGWFNQSIFWGDISASGAVSNIQHQKDVFYVAPDAATNRKEFVGVADGKSLVYAVDGILHTVNFGTKVAALSSGNDAIRALGGDRILQSVVLGMSEGNPLYGTILQAGQSLHLVAFNQALYKGDRMIAAVYYSGGRVAMLDHGELVVADSKGDVFRSSDFRLETIWTGNANFEGVQVDRLSEMHAFIGGNAVMGDLGRFMTQAAMALGRVDTAYALFNLNQRLTNVSAEMVFEGVLAVKNAEGRIIGGFELDIPKEGATTVKQTLRRDDNAADYNVPLPSGVAVDKNLNEIAIGSFLPADFVLTGGGTTIFFGETNKLLHVVQSGALVMGTTTLGYTIQGRDGNYGIFKNGLAVGQFIDADKLAALRAQLELEKMAAALKNPRPTELKAKGTAKDLGQPEGGLASTEAVGSIEKANETALINAQIKTYDETAAKLGFAITRDPVTGLAVNISYKGLTLNLIGLYSPVNKTVEYYQDGKTTHTALSLNPESYYVYASTAKKSGAYLITEGTAGAVVGWGFGDSANPASIGYLNLGDVSVRSNGSWLGIYNSDMTQVLGGYSFLTNSAMRWQSLSQNMIPSSSLDMNGKQLPFSADRVLVSDSYKSSKGVDLTQRFYFKTVDGNQALVANVQGSLSERTSIISLSARDAATGAVYLMERMNFDSNIHSVTMGDSVFGYFHSGGFLNVQTQKFLDADNLQAGAVLTGGKVNVQTVNGIKVFSYEKLAMLSSRNEAEESIGVALYLNQSGQAMGAVQFDLWSAESYQSDWLSITQNALPALVNQGWHQALFMQLDGVQYAADRFGGSAGIYQISDHTGVLGFMNSKGALVTPQQNETRTTLVKTAGGDSYVSHSDFLDITGADGNHYGYVMNGRELVGVMTMKDEDWIKSPTLFTADSLGQNTGGLLSLMYVESGLMYSQAQAAMQLQDFGHYLVTDASSGSLMGGLGKDGKFNAAEYHAESKLTLLDAAGKSFDRDYQVSVKLGREEGAGYYDLRFNLTGQELAVFRFGEGSALDYLRYSHDGFTLMMTPMIAHTQGLLVYGRDEAFSHMLGADGVRGIETGFAERTKSELKNFYQVDTDISRAIGIRDANGQKKLVYFNAKNEVVGTSTDTSRGEVYGYSDLLGAAGIKSFDFIYDVAGTRFSPGRGGVNVLVGYDAFGHAISANYPGQRFDLTRVSSWIEKNYNPSGRPLDPATEAERSKVERKIVQGSAYGDDGKLVNVALVFDGEGRQVLTASSAKDRHINIHELTVNTPSSLVRIHEFIEFYGNQGAYFSFTPMFDQTGGIAQALLRRDSATGKLTAELTEAGKLNYSAFETQSAHAANHAMKFKPFETSPFGSVIDGFVSYKTGTEVLYAQSNDGSSDMRLFVNQDHTQLMGQAFGSLDRVASMQWLMVDYTLEGVGTYGGFLRPNATNTLRVLQDASGNAVAYLSTVERQTYDAKTHGTASFAHSALGAKGPVNLYADAVYQYRSGDSVETHYFQGETLTGININGMWLAVHDGEYSVLLKTANGQNFNDGVFYALTQKGQWIGGFDLNGNALYLQNNSATQAQARLREEQLNKKTPLYGQGKDGALEINGNELGISTSADRMLMNASGRTQIYLSEAAASGDRSVVAAFNGLDLNTNGWSALTYLKTDAYTISRLQKVAGVFQIEANGSTYLAHQMGWKPDQFVDRDTNGTLLDARESNHGFKLENGGSVSEQINLNGKSGVYVQFAGPESSKYPEQGLRLFLNESGAGYSLVASFKGIYSGSTDMDALNTLNAKQVLSVITDTLALRAHDVGSFGRVFDIHYTADKKQKVVALEGDGGIFEIPKMTSSITHDAFKAQLGRAGNYFNELSQSVVAGTTGSALPADWSTAEINNAFVTSLRSESGQRLDLMFNFDANGSFRPIYEKTNYDDGFEEKITIGNHNYVENWSTKTEAKWVSGASAGVGGPGGYLSHYIVRDKTLNRQWFEDGTLQSAWISQTGNFYTGDQLFFSDLGRTWFVLAGNPQAGFAPYSLRPFDETVRMDYQNGYLKEHISGSIIDNGNVIISEMVISTNAANRSEKYYWFDKGFLQEKWTVMPTAGEHTKDLSLWGGGNEKFTITFNEHGQITHLNQLNDNDFSNRTFTYDSSNYLYAVEQQIAADRNIVHAIDYFDTEGRYERTELLYQHYVTFGELSLGQQAAQVGIIAGAVVVAGLVIYFSGGTATGVVATLGAKFALGGMIGASVLAYGAGAYYFGQESGLWGVSGGGEFAMQMAPVLATLPFMGLTSLTLTRAMVMTAARTGAYTSLTGLTIGAGTGLSLGALDRELKDIPAPIVSLFRVVSFGSFDTFYGIGRNGLSAQNWRAVAGELSVSAAIGFATGTTLRLFRPEVALTKSALPTRVAGFGIQKGITAVTYTSAGIALASGVVHAITGDALSAKISQLFSQVTVVGFLALQGPGLLLSRGFLTAGGIGLSAIFIDTLTGNHGAAWLIDMENGGTSVNLLRALLGMDVSEKAETIYSWRYALFAGSLVLGTKLLTRGVSWASRFSNVLSKTFKGAASLEVSAELRVATKAAAHWDAVKALRGAESWSWMGAGKAAGVVWHSLAGGFRSGQALLLQTTSAHRFTGFLLNKMGSGFYYAARWMAQGSEWGSKALGSFKASLGRSFKNEKWVKSGEQMVRTARIQEMKLRLSFKKDFNVSNEKLNTIRNFVASRAGDKLEFGALRAKLINKVKNVFGAGEIQILNSVNQIETVTAGRELTLAGNTVPTLITRAGIAQHAWLGEVNGIRSFFGTESILSYKILMGSGSGMLNEFFRIAKFNLYLAPFGLMQSVTNVNNKTDSVMDQLFGALGFSVYEKQLAKDAFGRAMKDEHGNDIQENKVGEDGRLVWKNAYQIYRDDFLRGYGFEGGVLTPHGVSMAFATASVFYIASPLMERFAQTMLGTLGRFEASFNKFLKTHFRSLDSVLSKTGLSLTGVIDRELIVKMSASVYEETIIEPIFKSVYSMTVTSFSFALASLLTKGLSDETPGGQQLHGLTAAALAGQIQRMLLPLGDYLAEFTTPGGPVSISGVTALSDTARALGQSSLHVAARAGITLGDARSSLDFQAAGITDAVMSRLGITNDTLLLDVYDRLQQGLAFAPALSGALNSPEGFADFMNGTQGAAAIAFLGSVGIITGVTPTMPST